MAYTVLDNYNNVSDKGKFTIGNGVDLGIMAVTTIGSFVTIGSAVPVVGLGYLGTDVLLEITTGKGVREHIDEQFDNIGFNMGF